MRRLWLVGLAAAALVAVAALLLRDAPPTLDEAASDLVASGVPGVIVRLRDGEEVRELAKGEASVDDRFRIGSVTKTFVAALTLDLADLGILSLDETVADFEPDLVSDADEITIRELLSHRAGLFDYTSDPALLRGELDPRALVGIADGKPRATGYAYSSTNYLVLGFVLQRAGLAGLDQMLQRQILKPYGLTDTTFEPDTVDGPHLHGHERPLRDGIATGSLTDTSDRTARSAWAAGAMVSTAADLDRFFTRLLGSDLGRTDAPARRRSLRARAGAVRDRVRPGRRPHGQPARDADRRLGPRRSRCSSSPRTCSRSRPSRRPSCVSCSSVRSAPRASAPAPSRWRPRRRPPAGRACAGPRCPWLSVP